MRVTARRQPAVSAGVSAAQNLAWNGRGGGRKIAVGREEGSVADEAMAYLRLQLLGGFALRSALSGAPIPLVAARKPALLFAYLALQPGRPHGREQLAGLFWGDSDEI